MKADLRISIKDYRRPPSLCYGATSNKNLKVLLVRVPFAPRQFFVRMNGKPWPVNGGPVSLTRVAAALRKAPVKTVNPF
jgi:hypothetical protein